MGYNEYGQCGFDENVKSINEPRLLLNDKNVFDICCGYYHSFILTSKNKNIFYYFKIYFMITFLLLDKYK